MRELRVVGLGDDTSTVILEDPIRHERFTVPSDERLRAAARGDIRRLGQMEIETTSPLRPRDIQARVRAGESVEDVAAGAGVPKAHVERFAYPVLLERSRVAEVARRAHPAGQGGAPDPRTLGEVVTATLVGRGQDPADTDWDAWKADDGAWVVALAWRAGHSEHLAHWTYTPGTAGGVVAPRDEPAREVLGLEPASGPRRADGSSARPGERREDEGEGTAPVVEEPEQAALAVGGGPVPPGRGHRAASRSGSTTSGSTTSGSTTSGARPAGTSTTGRSTTTERPAAADRPTTTDRSGASDRPTTTARAGAGERPATAEHPTTAADDARASSGGGTGGDRTGPRTPRGGRAVPDQRGPQRRPARERPGAERPVPDRPAPERSARPRREASGSDGGHLETDRPGTGDEGDDPDRGRGRGRSRSHPIVPSWEDVLLGVRSPRT